MKLTTKIVEKFQGGQLVIKNNHEYLGYIFRGEIKNLYVENDELCVEFLWLASGTGFPPLPKKWKVVSAKRYHHMNLGKCTVSTIDPSGDGINDSLRLFLRSDLREEIVIYPPCGKRLDPALVEGLEL